MLPLTVTVAPSAGRNTMFGPAVLEESLTIVCAS